MANVLERVKNALGITGTYQDDTLTVYVNEVIDFMISAGVSEALARSETSAGVIARGVTDLWNYNGGAGKLSDYFYQRVSQLVYEVQTGKIITFNSGDYGMTFPVNVEGITINDSDTVTFTCGDFVKNYQGVTDNCILITFTESESNGFEVGTHKWTLKLIKDNSMVTLVDNGLLIVT